VLVAGDSYESAGSVTEAELEADAKDNAKELAASLKSVSAAAGRAKATKHQHQTEQTEQHQHQTDQTDSDPLQRETETETETKTKTDQTETAIPHRRRRSSSRSRRHSDSDDMDATEDSNEEQANALRVHGIDTDDTAVVQGADGGDEVVPAGFNAACWTNAQAVLSAKAMRLLPLIKPEMLEMVSFWRDPNPGCSGPFRAGQEIHALNSFLCMKRYKRALGVLAHSYNHTYIGTLILTIMLLRGSGCTPKRFQSKYVFFDFYLFQNCNVHPSVPYTLVRSAHSLENILAGASRRARPRL
jgi:hypothetical protein